MPSPEVTQLQQDVSDLEAAAAATVTELDALAAKIDGLIAAGPATPAELTDLSTRVKALSAKLTAADAADARP